jgi:hypothetical protein
VSPRYEFDPSKVAATMTVFPKGEIELLIGEPKSFQREAGEDKHLSVGIRYAVQGILENGKKGRSVYSLYLHNEGAQGFAKRFVMAALGYAPNEASENKFDEDFKGQDWSYDPTNGNCGDMWREVTGHRVIAEVDITTNNNTGDQMQQWKGFRPVGTPSTKREPVAV